MFCFRQLIITKVNLLFSARPPTAPTSTSAPQKPPSANPKRISAHKMVSTTFLPLIQLINLLPQLQPQPQPIVNSQRVSQPNSINSNTNTNSTLNLFPTDHLQESVTFGSLQTAF